jgi:hypothetical protein
VEEKPEARFLTARENAGQNWWEHQLPGIRTRFSLVRTIYWSPSGGMPLDLFSYVREGANAFVSGNFLGTMVLASAAVELVLNKDGRTRYESQLTRMGGWATLNNRNLRVAGVLGLPVISLLSDDETIEQDLPIRFVDRRNKVAHGDVASIIQSLSAEFVDYDPAAKAEAFDQLNKSQDFVLNWFNTSPDVRENRIRSHHWPG